MVYPSGKGKYTSVCLELALIREGSDPLKLRKRITLLAEKYFQSVVSNNLDDSLLNQKLPGKYLKKYKEIERAYIWQKWQKAFDALIWQGKQEKGKLLTIGSQLGLPTSLKTS